LRSCFVWADSAAFCAFWSVANFCMNPIVSQFVADEKSARANCSSYDFCGRPVGAALDARVDLT
jgi:hypothetical protein